MPEGVRAVILQAIAGEKRSHAVYRAAADRAGSGPTAELFRRLANDELRHMMLLMEHFDGRAGGLSGEVTMAMPPVDERTTRALANLGMEGILVFARGEEEASIAELEAMIKASESAECRAVLRKLQEDERAHLKSIEREIE
ncbi:MAG: ferritin family protein, partial [Candidatus Methylomirabilis sp.]|nr:ferritin family protein [Deltaproteobacteria bacterium]